jgi:hypothetical protein
MAFLQILCAEYHPVEISGAELVGSKTVRIAGYTGNRCHIR